MKALCLTLQALTLVAAAVGVGLYYKTTAKTDHLETFNVAPERMVRDMDGKMANLPFGQVWPFDVNNQGVKINVVAKKQHENYVMVLVNVTASADVPKEKEKDTKTPAKDKEAEKLPSRVRLGGYAKLTYENFGQEWYLVGIDSVTLRAQPED